MEVLRHLKMQKRWYALIDKPNVSKLLRCIIFKLTINTKVYVMRLL